MEQSLKTVGIAVRMETEGSDIYLVFKIVDEQFKREIINSWENEVDLKVIGTNLVK